MAGVNQLWTSPDEPAIESVSAANILAVLDGRFVRINQSWAYGKDPQSGSLLVGFDRDTNAATIHWIDTFHMGSKVMACAGSARDDGVIDVRGSYPAPSGPDWGWRIEISATPQHQLVRLMYNIHFEGKQELAVQATYSRSPAAK